MSGWIQAGMQQNTNVVLQFVLQILKAKQIFEFSKHFLNSFKDWGQKAR